MSAEGLLTLLTLLDPRFGLVPTAPTARSFDQPQLQDRMFLADRFE